VTVEPTLQHTRRLSCLLSVFTKFDNFETSSIVPSWECNEVRFPQKMTIHYLWAIETRITCALFSVHALEDQKSSCLQLLQNCYIRQFFVVCLIPRMRFFTMAMIVNGVLLNQMMRSIRKLLGRRIAS
jgi:hypothetical protein